MDFSALSNLVEQILEHEPTTCEVVVTAQDGLINVACTYGHPLSATPGPDEKRTSWLMIAD